MGNKQDFEKMKSFTEEIKKIRLEIFENQNVIDDLKVSIQKTEDSVMYSIKESVDKDGKKLYKNDMERQVAFNEEVKDNKKYNDENEKLKKLIKKQIENDINLEYARNRLLNIRLYIEKYEVE